jgi:hypothetical protein
MRTSGNVISPASREIQSNQQPIAALAIEPKTYHRGENTKEARKRKEARKPRAEESWRGFSVPWRE